MSKCIVDPGYFLFVIYKQETIAKWGSILILQKISQKITNNVFEWKNMKYISKKLEKNSKKYDKIWKIWKWVNEFGKSNSVYFSNTTSGTQP